MSASADLQAAAVQMLGLPDALRVNVPTISIRPKELMSDIEKAAAQGNGLSITILPVLPTKIVDDAPFVFVAEGEMLVRVAEEPARNTLGANAWQIAEDIANALQWQPRLSESPFSTLLAHPLQLAPEAMRHVSDDRFRLVDVVFNATYQLADRSSQIGSGIEFAPNEGSSAAENLQAAMRQRLLSGMLNAMPITILKDHDLTSAVENAGQILSVQIQPARPTRAMQGVPFVFYEGFECSLKVIEETALNAAEINAYDVVEDVMTALHWQMFGDSFLAHPFQLAATPTRVLETPSRREIEVIFNATMGFQEPE